MEVKRITEKLQGIFSKYKYAFLILLAGILLMLLPGRNSKKQQSASSTPIQTVTLSDEDREMEDILRTIDGVGKVQVMLSVASGERTKYVTDTDTSDSTSKSETVIVIDSNRNENGLVEQIDPKQYRGAVVVCQGADRAQVRLAVTQAVSKITGLSTDNICVLKMK
mgnify:CR=1 FL=1